MRNLAYRFDVELHRMGGETCKISDGHMIGNLGEAEPFGDMKIKVVAKHLASDEVPNYIVFDVKAPNYLKRGIRLSGGTHGDGSPEQFVATICDTEVTITFTGGLRVSTF